MCSPQNHCIDITAAGGCTSSGEDQHNPGAASEYKHLLTCLSYTSVDIRTELKTETRIGILGRVYLSFNFSRTKLVFNDQIYRIL